MNLQAFQEALGGIAAGPITESKDTQRRYKADGNTFVGLPLFPLFMPTMRSTTQSTILFNPSSTVAHFFISMDLSHHTKHQPPYQPTFIEAATRTCEVQVNDCAAKANDKAANNATQTAELSIDKCEAQRTRCLSFQSNTASVTTFPDQQSTTSSTTSTVPMTATTSTLSIASSSTMTATMSAAAAPPPPPPPAPGGQPPPPPPMGQGPPPPPGGPMGAMPMMPPPPPPNAGPTGTQLINLGPDPQFPMFDLLCDL